MLINLQQRGIYLAILFLTGLTSLIYQILWIREFGLFFGVHVYSLSTVLAAFMAGLALGSYLFGRIADKYPGFTSVLFFLIQVFLGIFALMFVPTLSLLSQLFIWAGNEFDLSINALNLLRPVLGFALLIMPGSLMGGVIPVASRLFINDPEETGEKVSLLYFINNAGAVAGCILAGFFLVATYGTLKTFTIAAIINFSAGIAGLFWLKRKQERKEKNQPDKEGNLSKADSQSNDQLPLYPRKVVSIALWVFAAEGFTTLAYQVLWTRMMIEFSFEKTIYFTTVIIASFILGLTIGSYTYYKIQGRIKNTLFFLGTIQILAGFSSFLLFIIFSKMAPDMVFARKDISEWWILALREYTFVSALLVIPTFFTGMSFPLISGMYTRSMKHVGTRIGIAGMLDTAGSIAGSLVAGFLMLPILGVYYSFVLVVAMNILLGMIIFYTEVKFMILPALPTNPAILKWSVTGSENKQKRFKNISLLIGLPILFVVSLSLFPKQEFRRLQDDIYRGDKIIFQREGSAATVRVNQLPSGHQALVINGAKTAFTNTDDLRVHKMLAYLPWIMNPDAQSAYVIGFGMGVTAATLDLLPVKEFTVADISPELMHSASVFAPFNRGVVNSEKFTFIPEDGRSYLLRSREKFDIITSNAVHARLNANLYTREFYQICIEKLSDNGVMAQWIPTNWMNEHEFKSLISAFTDVFPNSSLWFVTRGHLIIIGQKTQHKVSYKTIEDLYRNRIFNADLSEVDIFTPQKFTSNLLMTGSTLGKFGRSPLSNTDNLPVVEFSRETDLKPNASVLWEISESPKSFISDVNFHNRNYSLFQQSVLDVIDAEASLIRQYLKIFVQAYGANSKIINDLQMQQENLFQQMTHQNWQFREKGSAEWLPANVPGSVHQDLRANNKIPDPLVGFNETEVQWIENKDWEYKTSFDISAEVLQKSVLEICFQGLDTYADVYLNDSLLFNSENMFVGQCVNIKNHAKEGINTLKIVFDSPVRRGMEKLTSLPYILPAVNEQAPEDQRTNVFTRKAPFHYGWDWGPRLVTSGIWRPVLLRGYNTGIIHDIYLITTSADERKATIQYEAEIEAAITGDYTLDLLVNGKPIESKILKNLQSGINKVKSEFSIQQPRLWWPNGLGEPYEYDMEFRLSTNNILQHSRKLDFGVRTLELVQNPDSIGHSFHFEVNGVPVFIKGSNIIPSETITPAVAESTYRKMIKAAVDANMNMLRVWGGAIYEEDLFYRLCNENGLLVWQDFMFACALQPGDEAHLENIKQEAEYNVKRLRNNACIALWCGNNENLIAWHEWGWKNRFEPDVRDHLWRTYERIFYEILPEAVNTFDPKTTYWSSSPSTIDKQLPDRKSGDEHDWTIWFARKPFDAYWEEVPRFVSEWGLQAFPSLHTLKSFAKPTDLDPFSPLMRHRQRSKLDWMEPGYDGNDLIKFYMGMYFEIPDNFDEFVYVSQLTQALAYKTAIEAHRSHMPHCMGTLYWQLNDCWPTISWATADYYYRWKASHYAVKRAFSPVIVTAHATEDELSIYGVSDLRDKISGVLKLNLLTFNGETLYSREIAAELIPGKSSTLARESISGILNGIAKESVFLSLGIWKNNELIAENIYYFDTPKKLELPKPIYSHQFEKVARGYKLTIRSETLIKDLYIETTDPEAFIDDNFFDLLPGHEKTVLIESNKELTFNNDITLYFLNHIKSKKITTH